MSDQALIERLKAENAKYAQLLRDVERQLKEAHQKNLQHVPPQLVNALRSELSAANKIMWAMAHTNGGKIEVSDASMQLAADEKNVLEAMYSHEKRVTVILATTRLTPDNDATVH